MKTVTMISFLYLYEGKKYVVMAKMKNRNEIESYEVHFIRSNGYIAKRKVWDITNSISKSLAKRVEDEIHKRAHEKNK